MSEWKGQQKKMENNGNSLTWKSIQSFVGLPEVWMQNLQSIGSASGHLLKGMPEGWKMQNMNKTTSQLTSLFNNQNSLGSMSILPEMFDTLSVRNTQNEYNSLPTEWMNAPQNNNQATNSYAQHNQVDHHQQHHHPDIDMDPMQHDGEILNNGVKRSTDEDLYETHDPLNNVLKVPRHESNDPRTQYQSSTILNSSTSPTSSFSPAAQPFGQPIKMEMNLRHGPGSVVSSESGQSQTMSSSQSNSANCVRWNSWSHEEEVFLVVAVLDRFFRRGSLASAGKGSNSSNVDCWAEIKKMYDKICNAWHAQPENKVKPSLIARSTSALCRHFKIMKVRASEGDAAGTNDGNFRRFLREWDTIYNLNGKLVPEDY